MDRKPLLVPLLFLLSFNLLQFSTYVLNLPPLFLVSKALLVLIFLGGALRLVKGDNSKQTERHHSDFFSLDSVEKFSKSLLNKTNYVLSQTKSVVLWDDPVKTLYSLFLLYLLSLVLKVLPSVLVTFVLVWVAFLYVYMNEFFRRNVYKHVEPYMDHFVNFVYKLYNTIPKLNEDKLLQ